MYEPIINTLGGFKLNQIYYIPLACIIDFLIGSALSFVLSKFKYTKNHFLISLIIKKCTWYPHSKTVIFNSLFQNKNHVF